MQMKPAHSCWKPSVPLQKQSLADQIPPEGAERPVRFEWEWAWTLVIFCCGSGLLFWTFWDTVTAVVAVWGKSASFGHGYFIVPIVAFLIYRLRYQLLRLRPMSNPWALIVIAGWLAVMTLGELANLMIVKQFAFVGLWQGFFFLVAGWRATRTAAFPLAYLFFAVPFGYSIIPFLQDVTAQFVVHLVRFSGVPIFLEGYYIQIPTGNFLVAEACSGVRYLMVCLAIGFLTAHLFFRSRYRQAIFIGLSFIVPIVANGVRAYGIVMLAHLSDNRIAVGVDHVLYGFVFLSLVTLALLGFGVLLRDPIKAVAPRHEGVFCRSGVFEPSKTAVQSLTGALGIAIILSGQSWALAAKAPPTLGMEVHLLPPIIGANWEPIEESSPLWEPSFKAADLEFRQSYATGGQQIDLHIAYYTYQREGSEVVNDINSVAGGIARSSVLLSKRLQIDIDGALYPVTQSVILSNGRKFLVWDWYWIGGESTNSRLKGKLLEIRALAVGSERAAAIVAMGAKVDGTIEEAEQYLHDFFAEAVRESDLIVRTAPTIGKPEPGMADSAQ